jgi:hypothetical protein
LSAIGVHSFVSARVRFGGSAVADKYPPWWRVGDSLQANANRAIKALGDATVPNKDVAPVDLNDPRNPAVPYVSKINPRELDMRDIADRKTFIDWPWLHIERHFGHHFDEQEYVIELAMPWRLRYNINNGPWHPRARRTVVLVFGRAHTSLAKGGWHARGALGLWNRDIF